MEFLKEFLSDETYAKVEEELEGKEVKLANLKTGDYVSKDKYSALETANNDLKTQLAAKTTAFEELSAKAGDNEALKAELERLKTESQAELNKATDAYEAKLKAAAVKSEIIKSKAKDVNDIIGQLDLDAVTVKDGETLGLDEQIKKIKEAKPYLFEDEHKGKGGLDHSNNDDNADDAAIRRTLGLPIKK